MKYNILTVLCLGLGLVLLALGIILPVSLVIISLIGVLLLGVGAYTLVKSAFNHTKIFAVLGIVILIAGGLMVAVSMITPYVFYLFAGVGLVFILFGVRYYMVSKEDH